MYTYTGTCTFIVYAVRVDRLLVSEREWEYVCAHVRGVCTRENRGWVNGDNCRWNHSTQGWAWGLYTYCTYVANDLSVLLFSRRSTELSVLILLSHWYTAEWSSAVRSASRFLNKAMMRSYGRHAHAHIRALHIVEIHRRFCIGCFWLFVEGALTVLEGVGVERCSNKNSPNSLPRNRRARTKKNQSLKQCM